MHFLKLFRRGELRLSRVEAFSDGVFAIVVTLLVLELKVPVMAENAGVRELGHQLLELSPKFLSWLISFVIVCKFWLNHHHIIEFARHADYGMVWWNSLFLMSQAFIPFPTAMMGEYPHNPLAVSLFGVVMSISTIFFIILQRYILRNLCRPECVGVYTERSLRLGLLGPLAYLVGAGVAWANQNVAFALYMITPLYSIIPPQGTRGRRRGEEVAPAVETTVTDTLPIEIADEEDDDRDDEPSTPEERR